GRLRVAEHGREVDAAPRVGVDPRDAAAVALLRHGSPAYGSIDARMDDFPLYRFGQRYVVDGLVRRVYRMEVAGAERIPTGGAILVANHESRLDPFALAAVTSRPIRYMAKEELWRWRWL